MYTIEIREDATKAAEKLPRKMRDAIYAAVAGLADNPRPQGCKKLAYAEPLYRIRVGDYRIIYTIQDKRLVVLVIHIAHRKDVYRRL
jgi:mRNA interferase RelE/StbE